ncbi:MAG: hypothetical protein QOJ84_725 [Bradyrhizobium sp.]|nr:hypothetical protein [Bradyrhizobium sp.]
MTMHSDHHDQDIVHSPTWQAMLLGAALVAVSVIAFWAYAA